MNITAYMTRLATAAVFFISSLGLLTSCDKSIFENEGDCDVTYRLRFRYDMNMKFADAFPHEVTSVHLYVFDTDGKLVWQTTESGDALAQEGYEILLPLQPGSYRMMAWCGLDNGESFTVPSIEEGDTRDPLHCYLNRSTHPEDGTVSTDDLHRLFHGTLDVELPENLDGGDYVYTMYLTKDTNVFRIVLQHLSGEDIDHNDFTFKIEDNNGWLHHDNSLRDDENITYHAWSKYSGSAGVDITRSYGDYCDNPLFASHLREGALWSAEAFSTTLGADDPSTRAITDVKVAVAELTVSRLVQRDWTKDSKPMLTIRKAADKEIVAKIPVIDYALLVKGNYNREMSDQEYLDRQDEYNMTFFLDENNHWLASVILINSWRVVLNPTDLE